MFVLFNKLQLPLYYFVPVGRLIFFTLFYLSEVQNILMYVSM